MTTNITELRQVAVDLLNNKVADWGLTNITAGEDDLLARADLEMRTDTLARPRLLIRIRRGALAIEIRGLAQLGSHGSIANRTSKAFLTGLFLNEVPEEAEKATLLVQLLQITACQYLSAPHTCDDLLRIAITGSNAGINRTRGCFDPDDGEIYVDTTIDLGDLPTTSKQLEDRATATIQHAGAVTRFVLFMRRFVLPDQATPAPDMIDTLSDIIMKKEKRKPEGKMKRRMNRNGTPPEKPDGQQSEIML